MADLGIAQHAIGHHLHLKAVLFGLDLESLAFVEGDVLLVFLGFCLLVSVVVAQVHVGIRASDKAVIDDVLHLDHLHLYFVFGLATLASLGFLVVIAALAALGFLVFIAALGFLMLLFRDILRLFHINTSTFPRLFHVDSSTFPRLFHFNILFLFDLLFSSLDNKLERKSALNILVTSILEGLIIHLDLLSILHRRGEIYIHMTILTI